MALGYGPAVAERGIRPDPDRQRTSGGPQVLIAGGRREARLLQRNLTPQLSLLCPRPGDSPSNWTCVLTHNISAHLDLHVPAPNVKRKGFDQVIGKSLAPKLLSTRRAARIPALENVDSQSRLAFQHALLCHNNRLTCTLTCWLSGFVVMNHLDHVQRPFYKRA